MGTSVGAGRHMVRIRASLQDVEPEVWRLIDVDAELTLEDLHTVLQVAFGWRQYHLHGFAQEESSRGERRLRRYWRDERSLAEGMTGVPEADARVGHVFAETHASVEYEYDFGDGWVHVLEWVDTCAGEPGEPRASVVRAEGSR